jgi:peptide/nickel transport system substrate-binding protein
VAGAAIASVAIPARARVRRQDSEITPGGHLLDSLLSEPDSLDPHQGTLLVTTYVLNLLFDRLVYLGADGTPQPWLAESWEVSDDETRIRFHLHEGVLFHDGTPLDAEAVKFTFDRLIDPATASPNVNSIGSLESTEVIDAQTVELVWAQPFAPAMTMLAGSQMGIISPTAATEAGDQFGRQPVGSGPFRFREWTSGERILFERNPDYVNLRADVQNPGPPHLDEMSISIVPEEGTRLAALETGELDLAWAPFQDVETIRASDNLQIFARENGTSFEYIEFNTTTGPFADLNLRQAVGHAVNPEEILIASYIYGDLIKAPLPIGTVGYDPEVGEQYGFTYDLEQAQSLMPESVPPALRLTTWNAPQAQRAAQVIQAQLAALGLTVNLDVIDAGTFLAQLREGDFEFAFNRTTWPDPIILSQMLKTPGRDQQYSNPDLDPILTEIETVLDPEQRQEAVSEAQRIVLEDAAIIPLFSDQFMIAARNRVQGFRFCALGLPMYQDVWLSEQ